MLEKGAMTRRQMIAALGMTGAVAAAGGLLSAGNRSAEASSTSGNVFSHVYGPGEEDDGVPCCKWLLRADSVEALLELPSSARKPGHIAFVAGYGSAGDGGEKWVRWEPDSTKLANGLVHDPFEGAGMPGRWETIVFDRIRVEALGAVGPDPTDGVVFALTSGVPVLFAQSYACRPFSVTDAVIDAEFAPGSELVFVHDHMDSAVFQQCSGTIRGMRIRDVKDAVGAGILVTLRLNGCKQMVLTGLSVENGKDLPVLLYECDDTWIIGGEGRGVTHRPFAWESVGSWNSGFDKCSLTYYQFGFVLLGPGYKSAEIISHRSWERTTGQKAINCTVSNYTGHAFDMNGTVGCEISGCVAENYTGTVGNSAFQIKQSTNIPAESKDGTWMNRIVGCTAIDCVTGFGSQAGTDAHFIDNHVIRAARYGAAFNTTPRVVVRGLTVDGWGMNLSAWPLQNNDTVCAAVALWTGSHNSYVDDLKPIVRQAHAGIPVLTGVLVKGHNCTVGRFSIVKSVPATMHSAIVVSGNNTVISPEFRVASPAYYTNNAVIDTLNNAIYPLSYGLIVDAEAGGLQQFHGSPHRGMIVGKIVITETSAPSGVPELSVGWLGAPAQLVPLENASSGTVYRNASAYVPAGSILQAQAIPNGSVSGLYQIRVEGVHLL